ncbi:hypothetical protein [Kineococcus rhizosphaerae]|uniref:hypothetical protein n=1 Tax=Kineococcus rhizosphaerae TaxID=559628 RepID=UPI000D0490B0|nr:hypothetical protein [Kineococcus rhizosphaerae]
MSQDRASQPQRAETSFLDALAPVEAEDLGWAPRATRASTTTSEAFGAVEVGRPVSRLAPVPPAPAPAPAASTAAPAAARPDRCPSCGARARAEQDWCSLCHTSLLPAPAGEVAPPGTAAPAVPAPVPPGAVRVREDDDGQLALDFEAPAARPPLDEAEVARMLGALSSAQQAGPRGLGSRRAKVLVAAGGAVGLTAVLLGGGALLGSVLG